MTPFDQVSTIPHPMDMYFDGKTLVFLYMYLLESLSCADSTIVVGHPSFSLLRVFVASIRICRSFWKPSELRFPSRQKKIRTTCSTGVRQRGHIDIPTPQSIHVHRCPHGRNAILEGCTRHIVHSFDSLASAAAAVCEKMREKGRESKRDSQNERASERERERTGERGRERGRERECISRVNHLVLDYIVHMSWTYRLHVKSSDTLHTCSTCC